MRMNRHRRRMRWLAAGILGLVLLVAALGVWYDHHRQETPLSPQADAVYTPEQVVYFCQKDVAWRDDPLGESAYTIGDSGCLVCCVAAVLEMQQIPVENLPEHADAGQVNAFLSANGGYDDAGNLLWPVLETLMGVEVVQRNAPDLTDDMLEEALAEGVYPMIRVRVGGDGSYHYVLVVASGDGEYWCMDPLVQTETLVPLSDFGGNIYAVRMLRFDRDRMEV